MSNIYATYADKNPQCPTCHSTSINLFCNINGQDHHACGGCNKIFAYTSPAIEALKDDLSQTSGTKDFAIKMYQEPAPQYSNKEIKLDYNAESKLNNLSHLSELYNIKSELLNLNSTIREILKQNNKLLDMVANDPLLGLKEEIRKFSIK